MNRKYDTISRFVFAVVTASAFAGRQRDTSVVSLERRVAALETRGERRGTPQQTGLFIDEVSGAHLDFRADGRALLRLNTNHVSEGQWRREARGVLVILPGIGGRNYSWEGSDLVSEANSYRFTPKELTRTNTR
jgi:hypothetical protein